MTDVSVLPRQIQGRASACAVRREEIAKHPAWKSAFANQRKDYRYYEIVEDTIDQGFDYRYLRVEDAGGRTVGVQPLFLLDQDLIAGAGGTPQKIVGSIRKWVPRFLFMRTLMLGCAAGEGHLDYQDETDAEVVAQSIANELRRLARQARASLVVLKEFHARYRLPLARLSRTGFTRVPSLPMTRLSIDYKSFDEYMTKALSKATRKSIRRKLRAAEEGSPLVMEVVEDISPYVDELHPLYLQVYERSTMHFEKLTKKYLCELGRRMPDKARFFIWRQEGKAVAFSVCLVHGDTIYDEYLGLDYSIALDRHLYFVTLRDIVQWGMDRGYKWYVSSALNYDPKLHLKCELVPLDLYVLHTSPLINFFMRRVLPWLEPTSRDPALPKFPNYAALWGDE